MRFGALLVGGLLGLGAAEASASPLVSIAPAGLHAAEAENGPASAIHHKPDHKGGPPKARGQERQPEFLDERPGLRRHFCRTTYESVSHHDMYVSRPVQTCSYGY